jgi:hypothetical protein
LIPSNSLSLWLSCLAASLAQRIISFNRSSIVSLIGLVVLSVAERVFGGWSWSYDVRLITYWLNDMMTMNRLVGLVALGEATEAKVGITIAVINSSHHTAV